MVDLSSQGCKELDTTEVSEYTRMCDVYTHTHTHTHTHTYIYEVMDILISSIVAIISQCTHISNHHIVYF